MLPFPEREVERGPAFDGSFGPEPSAVALDDAVRTKESGLHQADKLLKAPEVAGGRNFRPGEVFGEKSGELSEVDRQKQKLVQANHTVRPENMPTQLEAGKVYVLDGRDRGPVAMEIAVSDLQAKFLDSGLHAAPLGELR